MNFNTPAYLFLYLMISLLPFQGCGQDRKDMAKSPIDSLRNRDLNEWSKSIRGSFSPQANSKFDSLEIAVFLSNILP
jgi:hypothetical protein